MQALHTPWTDSRRPRVENCRPLLLGHSGIQWGKRAQVKFKVLLLTWFKAWPDDKETHRPEAEKWVWQKTKVKLIKQNQNQNRRETTLLSKKEKLSSSQPSQFSVTCSVVDLMFTLEIKTLITCLSLLLRAFEFIFISSIYSIQPLRIFSWKVDSSVCSPPHNLELPEPERILGLASHCSRTKGFPAPRAALIREK